MGAAYKPLRFRNLTQPYTVLRLMIDTAMWLNDIVRQVENHDLCIIHADPEWGAAHIIRALHRKRPLVWLALAEQDDELSIGYKLAAALERALERSYLDYGLSYQQGLTFINEADTLAPFTFAVSGAQSQAQFVSDLLGLKNQKLVLTYSSNAAVPQQQGFYLTQEDLVLPLEEARALITEQLPAATPDTVARLLMRSKGAYGRLLELCGVATPKPEDMWLEPRYVPDGSAPLNTLIAQGSFADALKLAVTRYPERSSEVLRRSRDYFFVRGLYSLLWETLFHLSVKHRQDETILFFLLSAARRAGKADVLKPEVESFLAQHQAPKLRALYSHLIQDQAQRLTYARQAYTHKATAFTAYVYGRQLIRQADPKGEQLLREALAEAEVEGNTFETLCSVWALAAGLILAGRFQESTQWSKWGLDLYTEHQFNDTRLWLLLANEFVYAGLLSGNGDDVSYVLAELEQRASSSALAVTNLIYSTLGDYQISQGNPARALEYYQRSGKLEPRLFFGRNTLNIVQALTQLGKAKKALVLAEQAHVLSKDTHNSADGELALGIALLSSSPADAIPHLQEAFTKHKSAPRLIQASLHLSKALELTGHTEESQKVLAASREARSELSETGFWLLGVQAFLDRLGGVSVSRLNLKLLGQLKVSLNAAKITLSRRQVEVVTLLSLYPEGLNSTELSAHLYGDENPKSVKSLVSRLREHVPIEAQPYRLNVELSSDLTQVRNFLKKGDISEAVALYEGELLSFSSAPRITAERELIRDEIAHAVLMSKDVDLLYKLCQAEQEHLELWEALLEALPVEDIRYASSAVQVRQIKQAWGL